MWSWWDLKHEVAFNTGRKTSWLHRNKNRMPSTALNLPKILVSPKWFQMMVLGHWCCWHLWCLKSVFHHSLAKQSFSGSVLELGMMQFEPQNPPKSLYLPDMPTITPRLFLCPFCRMFALRRWQRRGAPGEMRQSWVEEVFWYPPPKWRRFWRKKMIDFNPKKSGMPNCTEMDLSPLGQYHSWHCHPLPTPFASEENYLQKFIWMFTVKTSYCFTIKWGFGEWWQKNGCFVGSCNLIQTFIWTSTESWFWFLRLRCWFSWSRFVKIYMKSHAGRCILYSI